MENKPKFRPESQLAVMDQVRQVMGYYHYALRTQRSYSGWCCSVPSVSWPFGKAGQEGDFP